MRYSEKFKGRMVQRLLSSDGLSATALAAEVGVSQASLSRWLDDAARLPGMAKRGGKSGGGGTRSRDLPIEEKLRLVVEASALSDAELGEFLRRNGVHQAQLEQWLSVITEALAAKPKVRVQNPEAKKLRKLERELLRKDKALAEAAALLILKKKAQAIWGDEDDDT